MKKITLILFFVVSIVSCQDKRNNNDNYEKSFKEQKDLGNIHEYVEHFDSIKNIYSNYKYNVAFDGPDHWTSDYGLSEHTIFRTYQPDSAITFTINVIELKIKEKDKAPDIWELYQNEKEKMDNSYKVLIKNRFDTSINGYNVSKMYLKNRLVLKTTYNYLVREFDYEYSNTSIVYQTIINNFIYTFGLDVPTMFYENNSIIYNNLVSNIYFLNRKNK